MTTRMPGVERRRVRLPKESRPKTVTHADQAFNYIEAIASLSREVEDASLELYLWVISNQQQAINQIIQNVANLDVSKKDFSFEEMYRSLNTPELFVLLVVTIGMARIKQNALSVDHILRFFTNLMSDERMRDTLTSLISKGYLERSAQADILKLNATNNRVRRR